MDHGSVGNYSYVLSGIIIFFYKIDFFNFFLSIGKEGIFIF